MRWFARFSSVADSDVACVCLRSGVADGCASRVRSTPFPGSTNAGAARRNRNHGRQLRAAVVSEDDRVHSAALSPVPACFPRAGTRKSARTQVALREVCLGRRPPPCTSYLSHDASFRPRSPFFCQHKGRVQKGFFPVQQPPLVHPSQQRLPSSQPHSLLFPHP